MPNATSEALPPLNVWQLATMRLTAFVVEGAKISPEEWWSDYVPLPPDDITSRPKAGQHQQTGLLEGRRLVLSVRPDRVDWIVAPAIDQSDEPDTLPTAGSFVDVFGPFERLALAWLDAAPPLTRLAFGAVLVQPVADRRAGYIQIGRYLPYVKLDPDHSSDFLYQINRPRDARTPIKGLRVNRLTKWSVMMFGRFNVVVGKTEVTQRGYLFQDSACRVELDLNTAPDFPKELPKDQTVPLFRELVSLATEIAEKGDIP